MRVSHRVALAIVGLGFAVVSARSARAEEPTPVRQPVAVDLNRLGAELDLFADDARRDRLARALTGLGVGCVLLPTGVVLLGRSDGVSEALVVGLIVGGAAQLASVPFALLPTRMDAIRDDLRERRARDADNEETRRAIEGEWRDAAASARTWRVVGGAVAIVVGALHLAAGLTFVLAPAGIFGLDRRSQYAWGGSLLGIGASVGTLGVRLSLDESAEETSWNTYRLMTPSAPSQPVSVVGVAPAPGGAVGTLAVSF